MTTITGPITNCLGATFTGTVTVTLVDSADQSDIGVLVAKKSVTNGTLALSLAPNTGAEMYSAEFTSDSGPHWKEKWIVPNSELEWTPSSLVVESSRTVPAHFPGNVTVFGSVTAPSFNAQAVYSDALEVGYIESSGSATSNTTPVQTVGTGLSDLLVSPAGYTGTLADTVFNIAIDAEGTPDTFSWGTGSSYTDGAEGVEITGAPQTLSDGVSITFLATTGHTDTDAWSFTAKRPRTNLSVDGLTVTDDIDMGAASAIVLGARGAEGTWQIVRSGNNLLFQRYESDAWVTKSTITPGD